MTSGVPSVEPLSTTSTWSHARSSGGSTNGSDGASSLTRSTAVVPARSPPGRVQGQTMSYSVCPSRFWSPVPLPVTGPRGARGPRPGAARGAPAAVRRRARRAGSGRPPGAPRARPADRPCPGAWSAARRRRPRTARSRPPPRRGRRTPRAARRGCACTSVVSPPGSASLLSSSHVAAGEVVQPRSGARGPPGSGCIRRSPGSTNRWPSRICSLSQCRTCWSWSVSATCIVVFTQSSSRSPYRTNTRPPSAASLTTDSRVARSVCSIMFSQLTRRGAPSRACWRSRPACCRRPRPADAASWRRRAALRCGSRRRATAR